MPTTAPMEDGAESDASGDTVDLDSQKLDSLELDSQEPQSPESFLPDHIQLSNAAFASSGDLHKLLAKHNIDIDSRDPAGYTTLMTMITHKRRDCALVLLKHGAGVLLVNSQGWSAFHLAASTGDIEVLQALVAAARRASDTALAEALVSELVDRCAAPACPPAAAASLGDLAWPRKRATQPALATPPTGGAHAHGQDACRARDGRGVQGLPRAARPCLPPSAARKRHGHGHCRCHRPPSAPSGRRRRRRHAATAAAAAAAAGVAPGGSSADAAEDRGGGIVSAQP